jgi:hypothetical protein
MNIKNIAAAFAVALGFIAGSVQASQTLIATGSNLQNCSWVFMYGSGGPVTDALYCYDWQTNKNNKTLERSTYGTWCQINNVSVGYNLGGQTTPTSNCTGFTLYKIDMLAPASVTASVSGLTVSLSWPAVSQAQTYDIYRNGAFLVKVSGTSYSDSSILKDRSYQYTVRSCLGENCSVFSPNSETIMVYTTVPPNVFQLPKRSGSVLGVDINPVPSANYTSSSQFGTIMADTAKRFCVEQGYSSYLYFNTADNYGNGHWFYLGSTWYIYGGLAFKQITSVTCVG